jgi:uncharacterized protein DUF5825
LTAGDRTYAGATVLELEQTPPDLDLEAAVASGVRSVRILEPVELSEAQPRATLALVRLLREATADNVAVEWRGSSTGFERMLVHLPPPAPPPGEEDPPEVAGWREHHRPGLCHYRIGPSFVLVKDVRNADASARFRLEGDEVVSAFRTLEAVVEVATLDPETLQLLHDLEQESLVLRLGGLATLLPFRVRRWPVPADLV